MSEQAPRKPRLSMPQFVSIGLFVAAALLFALWAFVLRPQVADDVIGVDDLVNGEVQRGTTDESVAELGKPAPAVSLTGFSGSAVSIDSLQGKVAVINFWASTCAPCIKEMPLLESVHQELGDSVSFVGVDVFESSELGQAMIDRTGVTFPQTIDPTNEVLSRFGGTQLPHTVVLRADGTVSALHNEPIDDRDELMALIDAAS